MTHGIVHFETVLPRKGLLFITTILFLIFSPGHIDAVSLEGKLIPDRSNVDNGRIINEYAKEHKVVYIPEGIYYFSTPIEFDNNQTVTIDGKLVYNGAKGKSAVTIKGNNVVFNLYGSLSYGNTPQFIGESESNVTIGINFVNVCNSVIYINEIKSFNENIRVSGIGGGCSYNKFSFGIVRNCMVGLRIYQEDLDGKRGWANENTFYGGRFTNFSDWKYRPQSVAIKIAGPDNKKDSYNSNNSNLFLKQSFEKFETVVYARNTRFCDFLYARLEGSNTFVKFVGECRECRVSADYNDKCKLYDDSESLRIPIRVSESVFKQFAAIDLSNPDIVSNKTGAIKAHIDGCGFIDNNSTEGNLLLYGSIAKISPLVYETMPALNINSAAGKIFRLSCPSQCTIQIYYLTELDSKPIKKKTSYSPPLSLITSTVSKMTTNGRTAYKITSKDGLVYFKIPNNIGSIQIVFLDSSYEISLSCSGEIPQIEYPRVPNAGTSSLRPEYASFGQYYYDYTENSLMYWDGREWKKIKQ